MSFSIRQLIAGEAILELAFCVNDGDCQYSGGVWVGSNTGVEYISDSPRESLSDGYPRARSTSDEARCALNINPRGKVLRHPAQRYWSRIARPQASGSVLIRRSEPHVHGQSYGAPG